MTGTASARSLFTFLALLVFLPALPVHAGAHTYDHSGSVLSNAHTPAYTYRIESADNMYTLVCAPDSGEGYGL